MRVLIVGLFRPIYNDPVSQSFFYETRVHRRRPPHRKRLTNSYLFIYFAILPICSLLNVRDRPLHSVDDATVIHTRLLPAQHNNNISPICFFRTSARSYTLFFVTTTTELSLLPRTKHYTCHRTAIERDFFLT